MTCVVGLVHEGVTYIGADSLGSNGYIKTVRNDCKVFHSNDINNALFGFCGSYRMGQLLMYADGLLDPRDKDKINHKYLVTSFIPNVIGLFERGGFSKTNNGEKKGGFFLFAYKDKLFNIESDYQVGESKDGYDACGSGEAFALGSLHSTKGKIEDPIKRVHMALQAATHHGVGVEPPYYIYNTSNMEVVTLNK